MKGSVLLTGSTGFLGTQIARRLLRQTDYTIVALVRADDTAAAARALSRAWWDWPELGDAIGTRVLVRCGDVTKSRLGLSQSDYDELVRRTTHIIHTAADLRLNAPLTELRRTNVDGVANVLALAQAIHEDHGLSRLSHVSTAYVCGLRSGPIREEELCHGAGFASSYEQSKYEGELLVQAARDTLRISVFRPGMIVGDSGTGAVKTFNTVYFPIRLYLTGRLPVLPVRRSHRVNIVPVDYVADAIARLTFEASAANMTFHLTAPEETLPTAEDIVACVRRWAREELDLSLPPVAFVPPLPIPRGCPLPSRLRPGKLTSTLGELWELAPYFNGHQRFLRDNTGQLLGPYDLRWRDLLPKLLAFAAARGFMHQSGRTVHEQILYRLQSKGRCFTFTDIVDGRFQERSAQDVGEEIAACAAALRSLGVEPGDRAAIVGLNSSRYLALDVAIGLIGAVSVPLYYTSPPRDIDALIGASQARLLLVGAPEVLEHLENLQPRLPVVSFCQGPLPAHLSDTVLSWSQFLQRGTGMARTLQAPVVLKDQATIRYTSGTTGRPKGAVFAHGQLRWMGMTMASLLPWRARTRPATYLSFLPLNHVVEGILATYGIAYIPAPVHVYFLDDFRRLQTVLPRARPTVFFAVPRVYEKVWEGFSAGRLGQYYVQLPPGVRRRLLQPLLRTIVLRRAGLDHCAQLNVGSAPPPENLLQAFHDLGIEVHNAYGQTEAPLVSLNRLGANIIGTAGQLLPETAVRLADDGEVLVHGPQVTAGYFDSAAEPPVAGGWLHTGDIGSLTGDGYLVIEGRKKEFIATSYGKKIFPAKVEMLLRSVAGVDQAIVVGEGKPYCAALLWVGHVDEGEMTRIDQGVMQINAGLSHPEEVRRWAILNNDLSVGRGDLTAKLDLRREVVTQRLGSVIESLYAGGDRVPGVLHYGTADGNVRTARMPSPGRRQRAKVRLLRLLGNHVPPFVKRRALEALFSCTADGFGTSVPAPVGPSYQDRLQQYARFTRDEAETAIRCRRDMNAIQTRLYKGALSLGRSLRKAFHLRGIDEAMALGQVLYRMIDIDFAGTAEGEVTIRHCYFRRFYSGQVCRVISSLDAGLLAGLTDGAQLEFSERLTEGSDYCHACLSRRGSER